MKEVRLGVNLDHIATLRRLRDTPYPSLEQAAQQCAQAGADQITVHLREDRRHIVDSDVVFLKEALNIDLNLEMAATQEMLEIALKVKPYSICIVPEKREERTTEGGLDLSHESRNAFYQHIAREAKKNGIRTSFFIEPNIGDVEKSKFLGADSVELHTGKYCIEFQKKDKHIDFLNSEFLVISEAAKTGQSLGLDVHAGHGIDFEIAEKLSQIKEIIEYNIGHFLVCEAVFSSLFNVTKKMKQILNHYSKGN